LAVFDVREGGSERYGHVRNFKFFLFVTPSLRETHTKSNCFSAGRTSWAIQKGGGAEGRWNPLKLRKKKKNVCVRKKFANYEPLRSGGSLSDSIPKNALTFVCVFPNKHLQYDKERIKYSELLKKTGFAALCLYNIHSKNLYFYKRGVICWSVKLIKEYSAVIKSL